MPKNKKNDLKTALQEKSHFLFGLRATGKSSLVIEQLKNAQIFDLLDSDIYDCFLRRPKSLSQEIDNNLVVIDEIQKLPRLLDEVHRLIETRKIKFLLTGSSARKLRNGGANLLAGRARSLQMQPLAMKEITDFDLLKYPQIQDVILYGSRAKGNYREGSDIYLSIKAPPLITNDLFKIEIELDELMLPYKFDLSLFHQIQDPDLIVHIQRVSFSFL